MFFLGTEISQLLETSSAPFIEIKYFLKRKQALSAKMDYTWETKTISPTRGNKTTDVHGPQSIANKRQHHKTSWASNYSTKASCSFYIYKTSTPQAPPVSSMDRKSWPKILQKQKRTPDPPIHTWQQ